MFIFALVDKWSSRFPFKEEIASSNLVQGILQDIDVVVP
jgi:hypothetical protein